MGVQFAPEGVGTLYRQWAGTTRDVVVETDAAGFIRGEVGWADGGLFGAHLLDLIDPECAPAAMAAHHAAARGKGAVCEVRLLGTDRRARWCALNASPLSGGAVAVVLRSIDERRMLEDQLFAASLTDPLTGLTNRPAFTAMLRHLCGGQAPGCLAILAIDRFKALNLRHGHDLGDELLVVVADLLRTMLRRDDILSRIGGESFAVLLPGLSLAVAAGICDRVVATLGDLGRASGSQDIAVTLSGGRTARRDSPAETLKAAELAVTLARAKGGGRLELDARIAADGARLR